MDKIRSLIQFILDNFSCSYMFIKKCGAVILFLFHSDRNDKNRKMFDTLLELTEMSLI